MITIEGYLSYAREVLAPTEAMFLLVPGDKTEWKPTPSSFTTGQLMNHIGLALRFNARGIVRNEWALSSLPRILATNRQTESLSVEAAVSHYRIHCEEFFGLMSSMTDEDFAADIVTPQLGKTKKWRISLFVMEHHITHKAEMFMYLKILGVKVSTATLYSAQKSVT